MNNIKTALTRHFNETLARFEALHTLLSEHLQYVQYMTFQYLQEEPADRFKLQRKYGEYLALCIEDKYAAMCETARAQVLHVRAGLEGQGFLSPDNDAATQRLLAKFTADRNLFMETHRWLAADASHVEQGWEGKFVTVLPQTSKMRLAGLRSLALRDYRQSPAGGPVRAIVDLFHIIIERHADNIETFPPAAHESLVTLSRKISAILAPRPKTQRPGGQTKEAGGHRPRGKDGDAAPTEDPSSRAASIFRIPTRDTTPSRLPGGEMPSFPLPPPAKTLAASRYASGEHAYAFSSSRLCRVATSHGSIALRLPRQRAESTCQLTRQRA